MFEKWGKEVSGELQQVEFVGADNVIQRVTRIAFRVTVFHNVTWSPPNETDFAGFESMREKVGVGHKLLVIRDQEIR